MMEEETDFFESWASCWSGDSTVVGSALEANIELSRSRAQAGREIMEARARNSRRDWTCGSNSGLLDVLNAMQLDESSTTTRAMGDRTGENWYQYAPLHSRRPRMGMSKLTGTTISTDYIDSTVASGEGSLWSGRKFVLHRGLAVPLLLRRVGIRLHGIDPSN